MTEAAKPTRRRSTSGDMSPNTVRGVNERLDRILANGREQFQITTELAQRSARKTQLFQRMLVAFGLVVVFVLAIGVVAYQAGADAKKALAAQCAVTQSNRSVLKGVVEDSYAQPQLNLRGFPSYPRLDPATQAWVDDLQTAVNTPTNIVDKNNNRIPDSIDRRLMPVPCVNVPKASRVPMITALSVAFGVAAVFGLYEWRRHRKERAEQTTPPPVGETAAPAK